MNAIIPIVPLKVATAIEGDGMGCHSGGEAMLAAAKSAGKSDVLDQYAKDYLVMQKPVRTINHKACARPSARCALGCGCAAR